MIYDEKPKRKHSQALSKQSYTAWCIFWSILLGSVLSFTIFIHSGLMDSYANGDGDSVGIVFVPPFCTAISAVVGLTIAWLTPPQKMNGKRFTIHYAMALIACFFIYMLFTTLSTSLLGRLFFAFNDPIGGIPFRPRSLLALLKHLLMGVGYAGTMVFTVRLLVLLKRYDPVMRLGHLIRTLASLLLLIGAAYFPWYDFV
jgi:hypothetical protein